MRSPEHIDNKKKDILIFGKGPSQGLDDTTWTQYPISFSRPNKKFCFSLYYNESNSFWFVSATKTSIQSKRFWSKIISLVFRKYIRRFFRLNGCVCDFSVEDAAFDISNIIDIHEYLMRKT